MQDFAQVYLQDVFYIKEKFYKEVNGFEDNGDIKPDLKTEFQAFIDASSSLKSYNTIRSYKSTLQKIKDFEKKKGLI